MSTILRALRKPRAVPGETSEATDEFVLGTCEPTAHREKSAIAKVATMAAVIALLGLLLGMTAGHAVQHFSAQAVEAETTRPAGQTKPAVIAALPSPRKTDMSKQDRPRQVPADGEAVATMAPATHPASPATLPAVERRAGALDAHPGAPAQVPVPAEHNMGRSEHRPAQPEAGVSSKTPVLAAAAAPAVSSLPADPSAAPLRLFQEPVTVDGGASIEVFGNQHASVIGEATSLRSVVEEICRQAGIELRAYAAPDRRYVGRLQDLPLQDVFRSIFHSESYLVGMTFDEASHETRMTWLHVLGTGTGGAQGAIASSTPVPGPTLVKPSPVPAQKFVLSPTLMYEAFGTMDPARREEAQREALERLADPAQRALFLNTEASRIANVVANYEHSADAIRNMRTMTELPDVQAKLDEVLSAMGESGDGANEGTE